MAQTEVGYPVRPITKSTKIVTGKPFQAEFSETRVSGNESTVMAKGLFSRDSLGNTSTAFRDGSKERSGTQVLDLRADGVAYLLYTEIGTGMKVPGPKYKNTDVLAWLYEETTFTEVGMESISGISCMRLRAVSSPSNVKVDICVSDSLQAVIQERIEHTGGTYVWELQKVREENPQDKPLALPEGLRMFSPPPFQ
jgi:hypothetical protein